MLKGIFWTIIGLIVALCIIAFLIIIKAWLVYTIAWILLMLA